MTNLIATGDLVRVTDDIWSSMVGIQLLPADGNEIGTSKVSACVQILGEWEGAVRLDLSMGLARQAAAAFMGLDSSEVSNEQVRDTAGELANMTAGSLKTILPKPSRLSLPSVADGTDFELTIRHGVMLVRSAFHTESGSLTVTVFERTGKAGVAQ